MPTAASPALTPEFTASSSCFDKPASIPSQTIEPTSIPIQLQYQNLSVRPAGIELASKRSRCSRMKSAEGGVQRR